MKTKHVVIVLIISYCLEIIGGMFKLLHLPGAAEILMVAISTQVVGMMLLLYKLLTNPKLKEFMNW